MKTICVIIGFVLGVIIFLILMKYLNFLFVSYYSMVFIFGISVVLGYIIARMVWWLAVIAAVIGIVIWLVSPSKPKENQNEDDIPNVDENDDKTI